MPGDDFQIYSVRAADSVAIHVCGDLDLLTLPHLSAEILTTLQRPPVDIFLNFTLCDFFGAQTLGLLSTTAEHLQTRERRLVVQGLSAWQANIVHLCDLQDLLGLADLGIPLPRRSMRTASRTRCLERGLPFPPAS